MTRNGDRKISLAEIPVELTAGVREKMVRFAWELAWTDNQTQSAENAGYTKASAPTQGSRLARNSKVQNIVQWLRERASEMVEVDVDFVLNNLIGVVQEGMKPVPIMKPGGRESDHTKMADAPSAVRALELLGRYNRMWDGEIKQETHVKVGVANVTDAMSEDQWEALAKRYMPQTPTVPSHDEP